MLPGEDVIGCLVSPARGGASLDGWALPGLAGGGLVKSAGQIVPRPAEVATTDFMSYAAYMASSGVGRSRTGSPRLTTYLQRPANVSPGSIFASLVHVTVHAAVPYLIDS